MHGLITEMQHDGVDNGGMLVLLYLLALVWPNGISQQLAIVSVPKVLMNNGAEYLSDG